MSTQTPRLKSSLPAHLSGADRVWQGDRAKRMFAASIKWSILALVLLVLADMVFHLTSWARLGGAVIWIAGSAGVFLAMFWIALAAHSPLERVARLLESRAPALGSKLINIIQLQKQIDDPSLPDPTRSLARRAVQDADASLAQFKLDEIARTPFTLNQKLGAWLPIAAFALLALGFFRIFSLEARRFVDPFGDHPPFAFTTLKITTPEEDGERIIYRQATTIEVHFSGHDPRDLYLTAWDPARREATLRTLPMIRKTEKSFVQQLENITSNLVVVAHNKDRRALSTERAIEVLLTPQIEESRVAISLPSYTRVKTREIPYQYKTLQTLEGSELAFSIRSNRPLSGGEIKVTSTTGEISTVAMTPLPDHPETVMGSIQARGSARLDFSVKDVSGIPSEAILNGGLTVTKDMPPSINIAEPYNDSFIIISHRLKASFEASDDYGLKSLRIHRALNEQYSPPRTYDFAEEPRRQVQDYIFDLPNLGVAPGDVISFFAEAIDNSPQPQLTRSETRHLLVISQEQYNEQMRLQTDLSMVENKFKDLVEDFDRLVEEQERLANELEKLQNAEGDAQEKQKQLEKLQAGQSKLNQEIEKHAEAMEKFSGDEPLYDMEKDLQKRLNERAAELKESARANQQATDEARRQSASDRAGAATQASSQAAREQLERIRGSQQQQKESISEPLEDMAQMHELMKDFNQFQELYEKQEQVAKQADPYGSGRPLDNNDRLALQELAAKEESIRQHLGELSEKLKNDAAAAAEKFPKAAQSGKDLAEQIDQNQLSPQAGESSSSMLKGKGQESAERSEKLRRDMESIMNQCQACQNGGQGMGSEIDQYLTMQGMQAGETFGQMMQSRLFGEQPGEGNGQGSGGSGTGSAGSHAKGMSYSPSMGVLGGDSDLGKPNGGRGDSRKTGDGKPGSTAAADSDSKAGDLPEIKASTRDSRAVTPEILAEQYRGIVEEYFRALTRPRDAAARPEGHAEEKK